MVCPAVKLRLEALVRAVPSGWTETKLPAVGAVAVTLRMTAVTPLAGSPAVPVTWRVTVSPGPTLPLRTPRPTRVSISRVGVTGL